MNKNIVTSIALAVLFLISAAGVVEGATNIINNPGFESGKTSWIFYTSGTGTFTAIPPGFEGNNSAKLVLNSPGTNIQMYQTGIKLEPNTNYRLSFAAYSTSGHDVTVNLFKHVSPYTNYGLSNTFDLGTSWQVFNYEFTTKGFTNNVSDGRFQFWLAGLAAAGDIYYIDAIILEKVGAPDTAPPIVIGSIPTGTNVPVTTQITVTFNESMNQSSTQTAFSTLPATTGSFGWSGNMMIYTPGSNLAYNTTYTVTVGTGAKDIAGNNLQAPYSWQFTTINASTLDERVASLETRVAALEKLLSNVTRNEEGDIYIDGANLHIRDGSGDTDGPVNGLGNLIIGYNELRSNSDNRTGSHNLILGSNNNYRSFGGLVAGFWNEISGQYTSVSGGNGNTASGDYSSVSGGGGNIASGDLSSVSGGYTNTASGVASSISGGGLYHEYESCGNTASGISSSVSGGCANTASGYDSSVSGGEYNTASGLRSSVSGGTSNIASGERSSVSGGRGNTASAFFSSVSGGYNNLASGWYSSVSGGSDNTASNESSSVSGGSSNTASGHGSSVSGGASNTASGTGSSVSGGQYNAASGYASSVSGGGIHVYTYPFGNTASGEASWVGGGYDNKAYGDVSSVSGGYYNNASGYGSSVSGGDANTASGEVSSISGGEYNKAVGTSSSVSGGNLRNATGIYDWVAGALFQDQ